MLGRATLSPRQEDSCSDSISSLRYCLLPFCVLTHTAVKRVHLVFGENNKPTSCVFAFSVSLPPRVRNVQHLCTFQLVQTDHAWSPVEMATDGLHGHHKNIVWKGLVKWITPRFPDTPFVEGSLARRTLGQFLDSRVKQCFSEMCLANV